MKCHQNTCSTAKVFYKMAGHLSIFTKDHRGHPAASTPWPYGPDSGVNPSKGRADRPMTPPTHAASSMCFAPAPEVLDPPPPASGVDVQGRHGRPPEAKESPARRVEERPRTRAAPAAPQGGRGTSQAPPARPPHPSSGCCRWSAAAAPESGTTATRAPHACHDDGCTAGHGPTDSEGRARGSTPWQ